MSTKKKVRILVSEETLQRNKIDGWGSDFGLYQTDKREINTEIVGRRSKNQNWPECETSDVTQ